MPLIDMPLSELKIYKGAMTKPKDFDTFWDDALASLDSIDLDLSITELIFKSLLHGAMMSIITELTAHEFMQKW